MESKAYFWKVRQDINKVKPTPINAELCNIVAILKFFLFFTLFICLFRFFVVIL